MSVSISSDILYLSRQSFVSWYIIYFKKSASSTISIIKSCCKVMNLVINMKIRHSPSQRKTSKICVAISGKTVCISPTKAVMTVEVNTAARSMSHSSIMR